VVDIGEDFPVPLKIDFAVPLSVCSCGRRFKCKAQMSRKIAPQPDSVTRMRRVRISLTDPPESFLPWIHRYGETEQQRELRSPGAHVRRPYQDSQNFVLGVDSPHGTVSLHKRPSRGGRRRPAGHDGLRKARGGSSSPPASIASNQDSKFVFEQDLGTMISFNLSKWALGHRSLVWYFMLAFMAAECSPICSSGARKTRISPSSHGDPAQWQALLLKR